MIGTALRPPRRPGRVAGLFLLLLIAAGCTDPVGPSDPLEPAPEPGLAPSPVSMMSSASEHACALRANGLIECWGENSYGEAPAVVEARNGWFTHVDVNDEHSCAVRSDGVIQCWGRNTFGKAPDSVVAGAGQFVRVAAGGDHTCAVRTDGAIQCWGDDGDGQAPGTATESGASFVRATAGLFHTCGLAGGVAHCWGFDIGQAPATRASSSGSAFVSISSSTGFTCAVRADGVVECFGQSQYGEAPDSVRASASSFRQVSAGFTHACALRDDGVVQCWGSNANGEAPASWSAPDGSYFTHVAAGNQFTCAARNNGFVVCVGLEAAPLPDRPAAIQASLAGGVISLTWSDVGMETKYDVQRRTSSGGSFTVWTPYASVPRDVAAFADSALLPGSGHQYRVRACAAGGCSSFITSEALYTIESAPALPFVATATAVSGGVVDVAWQDSTGTETRFEIDRRHIDSVTGVAGPWGRVGATGGTAASYRDSTAVRAERYRYRVRGCNPVGCSGFRQTTPVLAETIGTAPPSVTSAALSSTQIEVQWPSSSNAATYQIQRRIIVGTTLGSWQPRATVNATAGTQSWTEGSLTPNTVHQYRVRGCTVVGCSLYTTADRTRTPS